MTSSRSISPDGSTLLFARFVPGSSIDTYAVSLTGSIPPRAVLNTRAYEGGARFSPDGRWLAYVSDVSGRPEVYVRSFTRADRQWPVSTAGGTQPVWSRDGREVFYLNGSEFLAVQVSR